MTLTALLIALVTLPSSTLADADRGGSPVLLEFTSPGCGYCTQMKPAIELLKRKGYPIKVVETDESPELAERYRVRNLPTFIVVDAEDGRPLARTEGATSGAALAKFYNDAVQPSEPRAHVAPDPDEQAEAEARAAAEARAERRRNAEITGNNPGPNPKPWETVVRIKVMGQGSIGFGSGTVIYSTPEESIILTCAHIFKMGNGPQYPPARFPQRINVDLFDGKLSGPKGSQVHYANETYEGKAVDYDFTRDVGLIRIKPGRRLPYARVVPKHWVPRDGMPMITVGCSEGQDATAWSTQISNAAMRGQSRGGVYEAIECVNAPKQGRSGGGLFTSDGYVAGVCDFAEPTQNHGLYAAPTSLYALLDRNRLMALYAPYRPGGSDTLLAKNPPPVSGGRAPITRGQSPDRDESGDLTMPTPEMLGIERPISVKVNKVASTRARRDAWHSPSSTLTTDLKLDPSADADHFESVATPAEPQPEAAPEIGSGDTNAEPIKVRRSTTKWRASQTPIPD